MGFFASRWIEKHGGAQEKAALGSATTGYVSDSGIGGISSSSSAPVKSRWYSRKPKDVSEPSISNSASISNAANPSSSATWATSASTSRKRPAVPGVGQDVSKQPQTNRNSSLLIPSDNNKDAPPRTSTSNANGGDNPTASPRYATDTVTLTLAQRLNELAAANADGLLDDDEYRILRQNIFERFGGVVAQVPTEQPMIKMASPSNRHLQADTPKPQTLVPRGDSNFTVSKSTTSIRSTASQNSSVTTTMTSLFRRATGRSSSNHSHGAGAGPIPRTSTSAREGSVWSGRSGRPSSVFDRTNPAAAGAGSIHGGPPPRTLIHKASNGSLGTTPSISGSSRVPYDTRSVSSRRTGRSGGFVLDGLSRTTSRSTRGPPSSYHRRHATSDEDYAGGGSQDLTSAEIRAEIKELEDENKRVMDMFNGLELSKLAKSQGVLPQTAEGRAAMANKAGEMAADASWTVVPESKSKYYAGGGVFGSLGRSSSKSSSSSRVQRKGSLNFLKRQSGVPPLPPLPSSVTHSNFSSSATLHPTISTSSHSRSSPHLPLHRAASTSKLSDGLVRADDLDTETMALQSDIEDIRRKKADVMGRYERRLEYLRARLKTAELHERLLQR